MNDYDDFSDLDASTDSGGGDFGAEPSGGFGDPDQIQPSFAHSAEGLLTVPPDLAGSVPGAGPGADGDFGGLFSPAAFPGAAPAAPAVAPWWANSGAFPPVANRLGDLQSPSSDPRPTALPPQPGASSTAPDPLVTPGLSASSPGALQWLTTNANDPSIRYDPRLRTVDRRTFDPSAPGGFAPMSPDQLQMFKERQLRSDSFPPGVKSPQETALDQALGDDGTPPVDDPQLAALTAALTQARAEGKPRSDVYRDTEGRLTVGIGHKVLPSDGLKYGDRISDDRVNQLFAQDEATALKAARAQAAKAGITDPNFIAPLAAVNFQLGPTWNRTFKETWKDVMAGNYDAAADEAARSYWAGETPARVKPFQDALRTLPPKPKP